MTFHSPIHSPSKRTLALARFGITFAVFLTVSAIAFIIESRSHYPPIDPVQVSTTNIDFWEALKD